MLEVLLQTRAAGAVEAHIFGGSTLHVPHLIDLEVAQVLRRYVIRGEMTGERADRSMRLFQDFAFERYPHHIFLPRVWALRHNLTAYDACYVALAEALDAPLVTSDARLRDAAGHRARVEVVTAAA